MSQAAIKACAKPVPSTSPPRAQGAPASRIGNQAALRLLAMQRATGGFQPKLVVGPVDDPLERIADEMVGTREPAAAPLSDPRANVLHRKCASWEEEEKRVRAKISPTRPRAAGADASGLVGPVLSTPGVPLSAQTRAFFEPRFGRELSTVSDPYRRGRCPFGAFRRRSCLHAGVPHRFRPEPLSAGQCSRQTSSGSRTDAHDSTESRRSGATRSEYGGVRRLGMGCRGQRATGARG
jgi:hypothetical protein